MDKVVYELPKIDIKDGYLALISVSKLFELLNTCDLAYVSGRVDLRPHLHFAQHRSTIIGGSHLPPIPTGRVGAGDVLLGSSTVLYPTGEERQGNGLPRPVSYSTTT